MIHGEWVDDKHSKYGRTLYPAEKKKDDAGQRTPQDWRYNRRKSLTADFTPASFQAVTEVQERSCMPIVPPNGLKPYAESELLSDALFSPMAMLKRVHYVRELQIIPHNHGASNQFLLVLDGETQFTECGFSPYHCPPGTAIIVPPHCEHWWKMDTETTLLQFHHRPFAQADFGHMALLFGPYQKRLVAVQAGVKTAMDTMDRIERIRAEGTAMQHALISTVILELLSRVVECSRVLQGELGQGMHPAVIQAIAYIDEHLAAPVTLDELSTHARLGKSQLCQLFRSQIGCTPAQYMARKKVEMAERLLLNPGLTVGEVANDLGFSSVNYFSRFFRKHRGITPSSVRIGDRIGRL